MATGGVTVESFLGKISRDHLECAVCADNFQNPKVLDCLHTFCLKCLREIRIKQDHSKDKKLLCPLCRKETNLEKIEVDDLPHNFTIDALVDELHVHQKLLGTEGEESLRVTCQSCDENQVAVSRCTDCNHFLCQDCKKAHGRLAVTRSHTTYSLDQFRSGEIVYKSKLREHVPKCHKHLDQSLSIYCTTCEQMTCTTCSVLNHGQHAIVGIPEAYDSFKQQVAELVSKVKNKIKEFQNATDTANMLQERLDSSFAETTEKISKRFRIEISKVTREQAKLTEEKKKIYKERSQPFISSAAKNGLEQVHLEQTLADLCNLMAEINCYEVLDLKQKVLFNLKELTEKNPTLAPKHLSLLDFVEEGSFGKLVLKDQTKVVPLPQPRSQHHQPQFQPHQPMSQPLKQSIISGYKQTITTAVTNSSLSVKKVQWVLKTELQNTFDDASYVGAFSNNKIVVFDDGGNTLSTFYPLHRSERQFEVVLKNVRFEGLTVSKNNKLIALDGPSVIVYGDNLCVTRKFRPGRGPNTDPIGIAVSTDNVIAVSYEDRGKISLHKPDGRFIKMLRAPGVDRYLTFYNNQLIYTKSSSVELISIDYTSGERVFRVDIDDDDVRNDEDLVPTGVCCDIDGSIYVASQRYTGEIHHFSPDGEYMELAIKGCGDAQNIIITPGGELVVAAGKTVKIYRRV